MLAMTAALPREISGVLRAMTVERREAVGACRLSIGSLHGRPLAVARSGVGAERARGAIDALRDRVPVSAVLSVGFGGALVEGLAAGDLVTSAWIHTDSEVDEVLRADPDWLGRLTTFTEAAGLRVRQGASVTAARMVTDPEQRRRLAQRFNADVVDMEGYWLAEACAACGVPFVSVRAVSDTAEEHHPVLERALDGDHVRVGRAVLGFAARPREMAKLPRLAANAQRAAAALTRYALLASAAPAEEVGA
jgi:adenosylhomocysteine nucleosidase